MNDSNDFKGATIALCALVLVSSVLLWLVFWFNLLGFISVAFALAILEVAVCAVLSVWIVRKVR